MFKTITQVTEPWKSLKAPPARFDWGENVLVLNDNELIFVQRADRTDGSILLYNVKDDHWSKWIKYSDDLEFRYHTSALSEDKSLLYIYGESGHLYQANLETKQFTKSMSRGHDGSHSRSLFINGHFHLFGGWNAINKGHFVWKEDTQSLIRVHQLDEIKDRELNCHAVRYMESNDSVLIIPYRSELIYLYSIITNKCDRLPINLELTDYSNCVLTQNEQYLICFMQNDIMVIDLKSMTINKSDISTPIIGKALTRNDKIKEELVTFGYIRSLWNEQEFSNICYPPTVLIEFIKSFICYEMVHVLDDSWHYAIDIDLIIPFH